MSITRQSKDVQRVTPRDLALGMWRPRASSTLRTHSFEGDTDRIPRLLGCGGVQSQLFQLLLKDLQPCMAAAATQCMACPNSTDHWQSRGPLNYRPRPKYSKMNCGKCPIMLYAVLPRALPKETHCQRREPQAWLEQNSKLQTNTMYMGLKKSRSTLDCSNGMFLLYRLYWSVR